MMSTDNSDLSQNAAATATVTSGATATVTSGATATVTSGATATVTSEIIDLTTDTPPTTMGIDRIVFDEMMRNKRVSRSQFLIQIENELRLLQHAKIYGPWPTPGVPWREMENPTVVNHIHYLFQLYHTLFDHHSIEIPTYMKYLEFCHSNRFFVHASGRDTFLANSVYNDAEVYIVAATFLQKKVFDDAKARLMLQKGLANPMHRLNKKLAMEAFWFEVQAVNGHFDCPIICGIAKDQYTLCIDRFPNDFQFHATMVDKVTSFRIGPLHYPVISDMVEKYNDNIYMWEKYANITFKGFFFDRETDRIIYKKKMGDRLIESLKVFENGLSVSTIPTDQNHQLWNMYMEFLINTWKSGKITNENMKKYLHEKMDLMFKKVDDMGVLNLKYYVYWAEHWECETNEIILKRAIEMTRDQQEIWLEVLQYFVNKGSDFMITKVLDDATKALGHYVMYLWNVAHFKYIDSNQESKLIELYKRAIVCENKSVNCSFKIRYLFWSISVRGVSQTRKLFKELKELRPFSNQLYKEMIQIEMSVWPKRYDLIRNLHEEACMKFGHKKLGVWVDTIRFEWFCDNHPKARKAFYAASSILDIEMKKQLKLEFLKIRFDYNKRKENPQYSIDDESDDEDSSRNLIFISDEEDEEGDEE